jgi:hypothetical protein
VRTQREEIVVLAGTREIPDSVFPFWGAWKPAINPSTIFGSLDYGKPNDRFILSLGGREICGTNGRCAFANLNA